MGGRSDGGSPIDLSGDLSGSGGVSAAKADPAIRIIATATVEADLMPAHLNNDMRNKHRRAPKGCGVPDPAAVASLATMHGGIEHVCPSETFSQEARARN